LSIAAVLALTCGLGGALPGDTALAENSISSASRIIAIYQVELAGFNLGKFRLTTTFRGEDYEMRGEGRFSILEGLVYEWRGTTASSGRVTSAGPEPSMYALSYSDGARKGERLRMTFGGGAVTQVSIVPSNPRSPHVIPVTKEQLEGVLDPMSGAFLSAHSQNPNGDPEVCRKNLPVFDGKQRFDLVLTPKRTVTVQRKTAGGYAGPAVICQVKFIPIAGYRPDNPGIRLMSQTNEIEVWLIPVRGTYMYVPYRIVLPTPVGYGSALVTSIQVAGARRASLP
jgi:hypothetical protein